MLGVMGLLRRTVVRPDVASGLIAGLVALIAVSAAVAGDPARLSVLVHMAHGDSMAAIAAADHGFVYVEQGAHYDGVYFYAMALDPIATGHAHQMIDLAVYRYGHPLYGWLAGVLSLGQLPWLPLALVVLGLCGMFVAGVAASHLWAMFGWTPWGGLIIAFNPGLTYAVTVDASEAVGAAVLTLSLLMWLKRWDRVGGALLVALCFSKEVLVLVPLGLAAWEFRQYRLGAPDASARRALIPLIGPILYAMWYVFLHSQFGRWPFQDGQDVLSLPLLGWMDSLARASTLATSGLAQVGQAAVPLLAVVLVGLILGVARATRLRWALDPVYLAVALLTLSVGWLALEYPKDLIRTVALPLVLLPFVLVGPGAVKPRGAVAD